MIKCRIYISSEWEFLDDEVVQCIELPCLPHKHDILYLGHLTRKMEDMATKNKKIAERYFPKWFYGKSYNITDFKDANMGDLGFGDANYVKDIAFYANDEAVYIVLDDYDGVFSNEE